MNQFKYLDNLFPCGAARKAGEVVSVTVRLQYSDGSNAVISHKRKAWYVNASVNAWHLHRGLCRDLNDSGVFPVHTHRAAKKILGEMVMGAYVNEAYFRDIGAGPLQYYSFALAAFSRGPLVWSLEDCGVLGNEKDAGLVDQLKRMYDSVRKL